MAEPRRSRVLLTGNDTSLMGTFASAFAQSGYLATLVAEPLAAGQCLEEQEFHLLTTPWSSLREHRETFEARVRESSCAVLVLGDETVEGIDDVVLASIPADADPHDVVIAGSVLVQQQARRRRPPAIRCGRLVLDPHQRSATLDHETLALTRLEFRILRVLAEANGAVVTRADLERAVWGHDPLDGGSRIAAHILRLRRKLDANGAPDVLLTVRGEGFRLTTETPDVNGHEALMLPDLAVR